MPSHDPRPHVAVIGAGPAGMTAAHCLARDGARVEVFEAGPGVGGLARTFELWGRRVDVGPHRFFSSDARVNRLWLEITGPDYAMVNRLTRILHDGKTFRYPLRPLDVLGAFGPWRSALSLASYLGEKISPTAQDGSFETWVVSRFGRRLYEAFFRDYSEKLWGIPCREIDAGFAAQRIKKLSLWEALRHAFGGARGKHRTLADIFAYPLGGTGMVYERMAESVSRLGGSVHLGTPVAGITVRNGTASGIETADGRKLEFDHVVSTMPLTQLVRSLHAPAAVAEAASKLTFRNTILVYLLVGGDHLFPDNWIYIHSPGIRTGRITNFRNWVPQLHNGLPGSVLALEFWCNDGDDLWSTEDDRLVETATEDLRRTGLAGNAPVIEGRVLRVPRSYPVYRHGYTEHVSVIRDHLRTIGNLQVIGRYGSFKYNNQDHSILMGILSAENILRGSGHDLWSVNSDDENYQEASRITATGLEIL